MFVQLKRHDCCLFGRCPLLIVIRTEKEPCVQVSTKSTLSPCINRLESLCTDRILKRREISVLLSDAMTILFEGKDLSLFSYR